MEINIRLAEKTEYEAVRDFYYNLIDDMQQSPYHPKWQKGVYPEDEYLEKSVISSQMYIALSENQIIGAMILNSKVTDGYGKVSWGIETQPDEIAVIHALGVSPSFQHRSVAQKMVLKAIKISRESGKKAMRLDVLCDNIPALRLYKKLGFEFRERIKLFYEDTGECDFDIFEYIL